MLVEETATDGLSRSFTVTIPRDDLAARLDARIAEIQPQVRLKGFRPGKVPASHIRKMFGSSMMQEIVEAAVSESTQKTLDERSLRAAGTPEIALSSDADAVSKGDVDLAFEMRVEVMPEFEPADPRGLTLERPISPVSDVDVNKTLAELAENQKVFEDKDDPVAENGDAVTLDFTGFMDGEAFEGGAAEGAQIVLGEGRLIPGFEEQLVGARPGDTPSLQVTFPGDYAREEFQGRDAVFEVTVHQVQARKPVEVSDELATQMGFDDLGALTDAVRGNLEREHAQQSRHRVKRRLLDALDAAHTFALPGRMVEAEFEQIWRQVEGDLERNEVAPEDADKTPEELKAEYEAIAQRRVRLGLVLAEIGNAAGVQVPDEDVARAVNLEARRYPGREREVAEFYQKNAQARAQLRAPLFEERVVDYILELATVEDVVVDRETLFQDD